MIRLSPRLFLLLLFLLTSAAIWLIWFATPYGMGLTDDAIAYIAAARTLLAGDGYRAGWLASQRPLVHFPPLFPAVLALLSAISGLDAYRIARGLNALLFGGSAFLMGWLGWRMTRRHSYALLLALLFILNSGLLRIYTYALSEPLYIFLTLLAFSAWLWREENSEAGPRWLSSELMAGLISGLAYLTRYASLALIATFLVLPFFLPLSWRERLKRIGLFLLGAFPLPLAWSVRNWLIAENLTNRRLVWHPVTVDNLNQGLYTLSKFFLPLESWRMALWKALPHFFTVLTLLLFLAVSAWLLRMAWNNLMRQESLPVERIRLLQALYLIAYPSAMLASISLFDASTPLNWRILAPIYPSLLALAVAALQALEPQSGEHSLERGGLRLFLAGLMALSIIGAGNTLHNLRSDGQGFASWRWYDAAVIKQVERLPADIPIYTNQEAALYFYTGRPMRRIPTRFAAVTGLPNPGIEDALETLRQEVLAGKVLIAYFDLDNAPEEHRPLLNGLPVIAKTGRDALFGLKEILP